MKASVLKISFFALLLSSISSVSFASNSLPVLPKKYTKIKAQFPGGMSALAQFFGNNLQYPMDARENGVEGTVLVKVSITAEGKVQTPKVIESVGNGCDEEAIRVVSLMPDWKPAKFQKKAVPTNVVIPIRFELSSF